MADPMAERRQRLHDERDVPEGCELVAVPGDDWRLAEGKRCRAGGGGRAGRLACGEPSVAEIRRSRYSWGAKSETWWAYCPEHMYAYWVEDGQVLHWILREKAATGA